MPEKQPLTRRWWFWTAIGAVVLGGALTLLLLDRKVVDRPACPTPGSG